jgi:hypothetical protein
MPKTKNDIVFTDKVGMDLLNFVARNFYENSGLWYSREDDMHWTPQNISKAFIKEDYGRE